jgi:hypothetical protein
MEASKCFSGRFPSELVRSAHQHFLKELDSTQEIEQPVGLTILANDQTWNLDTIDDFFAELPQAQHYRLDHIAQRRRLIIDNLSIRDSTYVLISLPNQRQIRDFFEFLQAQYALIFEEEKEAQKAPERLGNLEKVKLYRQTIFSPQVVRMAYDDFLSRLGSNKDLQTLTLRVQSGSETWAFASVDEFFAELRSARSYRLHHYTPSGDFLTELWENDTTKVSIALPRRSDIQGVFQIFEDRVEESRVPSVPEPMKVFIGHGRDSQWRDLKDHLQDLHGFRVVAYEIGPRAGLSVKQVLEDMLDRSSFALLVLTGEDIHSDGEVHARENVVHELGLFQGRLGFKRAVVLLEEGVHEFSNVLGVNQIRFSKDGIRETFGDVLATLRREFEQ